MKRSGNDEGGAAPALTGPTHVMEPGAEGSGDATPGAAGIAPRLPVQLRDRDRYHVLGEHGRGGLGRVSRAHDRELGRDVAIKELLACDHFNEARFLREVLITARLEHPGIVPIHEAGRWPDGTPFYAMKLVAGRPLRELISDRPVGQRLGLLHHIVAVADAIAYAHGRKIIHRDLKPANIIVGDFGETIVIDWGLAKDLGDPEHAGGSGIGAGTGPLPGSGELTSHGAILGTPAYMAPEQARGEPVDERADVYAIGILLWELCASDKLPPAEPRVRHRILRRADIDRDLAAIIDKAIDPDLERRYRDAGALAADLKAFTSGIRIAARRYSLLEALAHWTRHHRTLARSAMLLAAVLIVGGVAFVWNISAERDRADASQKAARVAQAAAEAALAELTLNHAQLLLATDPSAAVDELLRYAGRDRARAEQIRAEAVGRGVAVLRATPQSENVLWVTGGEDGVVTSLNLDGTIVRTSRDGRSVVAARGASRSGRFAYAERTHVLAYACDPADLCLFDVLHATPIAVGDVWRDARVAGVAFSADATSLALVGRDGTVSLFDMTRPAQPIRRLVKSIAEARGVAFLADDAVIVKIGKTRSTLAVLHANGAMAAIPSRGVSLWTVDERQHRLALATEAGDAQLFEGPGLEMTAHLELCHGPVEDLRFLSGRPEIAYACERGEVGTWSPRRATGEPRAQLDGRCTLIQTSASGEYILALGRDGVITLVDLVTGLATSYRGHPYRVQYVAPPTGAFPFVISADVRGGIRVWPLPVRVARVAATVGPQPNEVVFSGPADNVVLTAWLPSLTSYSPSTGPRAIDGHEASNINLVQSGSGATLATYGETDTIEIWSSANLTAPRLIQSGHGSVSRLHFIGDREDFLTAGHDGRLIRWSSAGEPTLLARQDRPIDNCIYVPATGAVIYTTADGALWRVTTDPRGLKLRDAGVGAGSLVADPDQRTVYVGYANGEIVALDTTSWQQSVVLRAAEAVHAIVVARDGRTVIATTNDGVLHLGTRRDPTSRQPVFTWTEFRGHAREVALAADGLVIVPFTDGTLWIYSQVRRRWLCIPLGVADLGGTAISANGNSAVVLGGSGRVVWIDLQLARLQLGVS